MGGEVVTGGYFYSVLRWRNDPTRDEARNVAVLLIDEAGRSGGIRSAPISSISPTLAEQGILDDIVSAIERRMNGPQKMGLAELTDLSASLQRSLYLTPPRSIAVGDLDVTLRALYRAYASPRPMGGQSASKGRILDRVVVGLRRNGWNIRRAHRLEDVMFDLVAESPTPAVGSVLTFASGAHDFVNVEKDAGHFLYGLEKVNRRGFAYLEPPGASAAESAVEAHGRILGWYQDRGVDVRSPGEMLDMPKQSTLDLVEV